MLFLNKEFTSFDNLFDTLTSDPFFLKIKQTDNIFLITHSKKTPINNFTRQCFGIIVDKMTLKPISQAFNKMWEITGKHNDEEIHQIIASHEFFNTETITIEEAIDGTLVRLYHNGSEWKKATKNCIDAYNSFWNNSKSFGEMFDECAFDLNYDLLDPDYSYSFVIQHSENRIIVPYTQNTLVHLLTRHNQTSDEVNINIGLPKPRQFHFDNIHDIFRSLVNVPWTFHGYVLINDQNDRLKIENPNYSKVKELKGNNTNIRIRILQLLHSRQKSIFLKYFPEHRELVDSVILDIQQLATKIHRTYIQRFVKKNNDYPQPEEYTTFLKKLDWLYHQFRKPTEYKDVLHVTMDCPTLKLAITLGYIGQKKIPQILEVGEQPI